MKSILLHYKELRRGRLTAISCTCNRLMSHVGTLIRRAWRQHPSERIQLTFRLSGPEFCSALIGTAGSGFIRHTFSFFFTGDIGWGWSKTLNYDSGSRGEARPLIKTWYEASPSDEREDSFMLCTCISPAHGCNRIPTLLLQHDSKGIKINDGA